MSGSAARRGRRSLWAILSLLFALGVVVSTVLVDAERNGAVDGAVELAGDEARLVKGSLTGRQLTRPVTGPSYDELAADLRGSASSSGSSASVTVWSSHGRILFSLDESLVGKTPPGMRSLITEAKGSALTRVVDETVQTFTPVSKGADGPVAIVQVDLPLAVVEAQAVDVWSKVRLGSVLGLVVSSLCLALTFVPSRRRGRARENEEWPEHDGRQEGDVGTETTAEGQPAAAAYTPSYEEVFGLQDEVFGLQDELDQTVEAEGDLETVPEDREAVPEDRETDPEDREADPDNRQAVPDNREADPEDREADPEAVESIRRWDEAYQDLVEEELRTQELMRQRREEFKARAEEAALRVKKLEAEPHEAQPTPDR